MAEGRGINAVCARCVPFLQPSTQTAIQAFNPSVAGDVHTLSDACKGHFAAAGHVLWGPSPSITTPKVVIKLYKDATFG